MKTTEILTILSDQKAEIERVNPSELCTREEEPQVNLQSNLVQIVIGVRRCGKSTLCQSILLKNHIKFGYVNFDDERFYGMSSDLLNPILEALYRINGEFDCLFFDEIQNVQGWHLFVNRMLRQGMKMILTGSNANLLSGEFSTYLTGRNHQIVLFPFSLKEKCQYDNIPIDSFSTKDRALRQRALDSYLIEGGFPELAAQNDKRDYIQSLLVAIVRKDVCRRYKIKRETTLWQIANHLVDNFCQEVSYNTLAKTYGVGSIHTVKNYVSYLAEAYLIRLIYKYSFKSKQRQTGCKCYLVDTAFQSFRENTLAGNNVGWRLENVVCIELLRRIKPEYQDVFYIRQNGFEVDFALCEGNKVLQLIQVTTELDASNTKQYRREVGGLVKGSKLTGCNDLTLIVLNGAEDTLSEDDKQIKVFPASEWLIGTKVLT
jgi:uncharacterized protein